MYSWTVLGAAPPRPGGVFSTVMARSRTTSLTGYSAVSEDNDRAACSIHRLDFDDRRAVIAADPEAHRGGRIIHKHAADIGRLRQQIFHELAGPGIEPRYPIAEHRAGPGFAVLVCDHVVGLPPRRRKDPFLDLLGLGIEHADGIASIFGEPETVLLIDPAATRTRVRNRRA